MAELPEDAINVKVKFFTTLRELTGTSELSVKIPKNATVGELLGVLSKRFGPKFVKYLFDKGELRPYLIVMVGGRSISLMDGLKTTLRDGVTVAILPPTGGG